MKRSDVCIYKEQGKTNVLKDCSVDATVVDGCSKKKKEKERGRDWEVLNTQRSHHNNTLDDDEVAKE